MIIHSKKNSNGSTDLDFQLEREDILDFEQMGIIKTIGREDYNSYKELANKGKFNNIPYNYITGYASHCFRLGGFEAKGVRLREYFRERYSNKDV